MQQNNAPRQASDSIQFALSLSLQVDNMQWQVLT